MDNIPNGAIPVDSFQAADAPIQAPQGMPEGSIPVDQFESHETAYEGAGQAAQSAVEGALGPIAGPGVDLPGAPGLKTGLGIGSNEAIRGRAEEHPITHAAGELAALALGPEGAMLDIAGAKAAEAVGLAAPVSYAARVGSSAVRAAAEMAAYQTGDEITKKILDDPNVGAQSAIANIGLAAALGAGGGAFLTGAVSPLWKATTGSKIAESLGALTERLGGKEGERMIGKAAQLEADTGVPIIPELKAVIDREPGAMNIHSSLSQTDTTMAGRSYQKKFGEQLDALNEKALNNLGHTIESAEELEPVDRFVRGRQAGDTLIKEMEPATKEINARYDKVNDKFKDITISPQDRINISEKIAQKAIDEGWHKAESEAQVNLASKIGEKLNSQATVGDLKKFLTNLSDSHPYGSPTYGAARDIARIIRDQQENIITRKLGPEELSGYRTLRGDYKTMMDKFDALNEHLHVGRYDGPQSFLNALKDKVSSNPEGILNSLSGKAKADVLEQLQLFPETLAHIKQLHTDQFIKNSLKDGKLNVNKLISNIENKNVSPQIRNLVMNETQQRQVSAIKETLHAVSDPSHNWSNTARTMAKLANDTPTVLSFIAGMMGHAEAGILGMIGKMGFNEGKDAIKQGVLKFLGSDKEISAEGLKAAISYIDKSIKGAKTITRASENVFKPGVKVLTSSQMPSREAINKLDKLVASNQNVAQGNKTIAQNLNDDNIGHYMPEHQTAFSQNTFQNLSYLQSLKPKVVQNSPLDNPIKPTPQQEARYYRALEIAQQPAIVLQHLKDGTLTSTDMQDVSTMYPTVYKQMAEHLTSNLSGLKSDDEQLPYKTRLSLSMFLGGALDSTMQPMAIMAAQSAFLQKNTPTQQQPKQAPKSQTNKVGKTNNQYQTVSQTAEKDRSARD